MKKRCSLLLAALMFSMPAFAEDIWSEQTQEILTEGVLHTEDVRFSADGWQRVNCLEIDLTNENLELRTLFDSRGIRYTKTVLKMAEENGSVAAVNGDFFNWEGTPLGFTVQDGQVISSPSHDPGLASLIETEDGSIHAAYVDMELIVTCPEGYTAEVLHINKHHPMQSMVLYTSAFGEKTPGSHDGVSELVAVDGIVQEIRQNQDGVPIPENGYVLAISTETSTYLVDNFAPGDPITLSYSLTPDIENIRTAIGGGTVLVQDGKVAKFTNDVSGIHPRTAAGVDKEGETLYLVTVDGRQTATAGMTQTALAEYMISIGAHTAINLDGGGSTTMVTREGESGKLQVSNLPSEGALRAVSTALGVQYTGPVGTFSSLSVRHSGYATEGEGVHLYLGAYDEFHNPVYIADRPITYSSPDGTFSGNIFYPARAGLCTVEAECGDISGTAEIFVLPAAKPFLKAAPQVGTSILLLPSTPKPETCLDMLTIARMETLAGGDDHVYIFGKPITEASQSVDRFSATEIENSLFVTVQSGGSIRTQNAMQWRYIMEICEETEAENVFFLLSDPLESFRDTAEAALFERMLTETLHGKGKDVFLVSTGAKAEMTEKNGVRYVTVADCADMRAHSLLTDGLEKCGVRFTLSEGDVHFEAVPIWEK